MGLFDFFKSRKNVLTDNGKNYIYYDNGKLKEEFTKINGVLHGEFIKFDESGKISTTIYYDGRIISLNEKIRIQNQEKENSLNEYKKNIYKLIEIDNVISEFADGNLIIQMTNKTLSEFSNKLNNIFSNYFEEELIDIYLFYKRNYLINKFISFKDEEFNLNQFFSDYLVNKKNEIDEEIKNIGTIKHRIHMNRTPKVYFGIYSRVTNKLKNVDLMNLNKNDSLITSLSSNSFGTIYEVDSIKNRNSVLIGLTVDSYYAINEIINFIREEFESKSQWEFDDKQLQKIKNKIYEHILSICDAHQCNQDEIEYNFENLIKSLETNKLSAVDLFEKGIEKIQYKDFLSAIIDFTKAIEINENYIEAIEKRGDSKAELKDYNGALEDYDKAIQLDVDIKVYYKRGKIKKELLDFNGALQDYNIAIDKYPDDESIYLRRSELKYEMGDYLGAINDISKCIALKPNLATYFCQKRGDYKLKIEDYHGAIEDYSIVIDNRQDKYGIDGPPSQNAANILALTYQKRGIARNNIKKYNEAINDFKYAIKLNPSCENDVKIDLEIANKQS